MSRTLGVYRSYSFRNKDPVIDKIRTLISDTESNYADISDASGVSVGTLYNWFHGKTRRPQFATVNAVARTMGHELKLVAR